MERPRRKTSELRKMLGVFNDSELMKLFDITESELNDIIENEALPVCQISKSSRLFLKSDVLEWIEKR